MNDDLVVRVQQAYSEVADICDIKTPRHKPWASANDAILLKKILGDVDKE